MTADEYRAQVAARDAKGFDRTFGGTATDAGITLLKGAIGLPEAMVGLLDIPTMGYAGKLLEQAGFKPKEAKEILDTYLSEAQQAANRKVREAQGFLPTAAAALQNPSTILTTAAESLPQMLGGAGIARTILKAAPKVGAVVAGAAGEGLIGAGSAAEQIRQEAKDKLLTGKQVISAIGSGVGTAAFGVAGGKLANKLGFDDLDTLLAGGASQAAKATAAGEAKQGVGKSVRDFALKATGSGISEGVFEELPQSAQEQMWMNYANDRPLMDGVAEASAMGMLAGLGMGSVGGGIGSLRKSGQPQSGLESLLAENKQILGVPPDEGAPAGIAPAPTTPPSTSPVVGTMTVDVDGKPVTKVTRQDGSVDIDGVQVTPPTAVAEPVAEEQPPSTELIQQVLDESQDTGQMMGELEGAPVEPTVQTPEAPIAPVVTGGPSAPTVTKPEEPATTPVTPVKPEEVVPPLTVPAGEYKPGQKISLDGREWRVVEVAHTGKQLKLKASDGKGFREEIVGIEQAPEVAAPEVTGGPTGGPAAPVAEQPAKEPATSTTGSVTEPFVTNRRVAVVKEVNGVKVPFYISTGSGGKKNVPTGQWYPYFGNGPDGWFNKGSEEDINNFYNSPELKAAADELNTTIGDIRSQMGQLPTAQKLGINPNEGLSPAANGDAKAVENIRNTIDRITKGRTVEKTPEAPVEEKPSEEKPTDVVEKPAEEAPAEEKPAEETPTEDLVKPAEEKPSEEKPAEGEPKPTGGPSAPAGGPSEPAGGAAPTGGAKEPKVTKPPKVVLTEEEKTKAAEEKAKAEEEKKTVDEQKKKLEEFNKQPMKVAMEDGNADQVSTLLYGNAVAEDLFPIIFPAEGLLRIPVDLVNVSKIEEALTKFGFRITDRSIPSTTDDPSYTGPERITISALYKPEKVSIQGGGAEFVKNRKGKVTAPPAPKDATDSQISKMLAAVAKDTLLDINSNKDNSFGAMMYKEGIVSYIMSPTDYMLKALKEARTVRVSDRTGGRQAIKMALEEGKQDEVQKLLQSYVDALQGLQAIFDAHGRIGNLDLALKEKYIKDADASASFAKYTQDGLDLRNKIEANNISALFNKMFQLFGANEDSTDQTNRIVKKETEVPPELGNIVRRGMRDHRQGRDVDTDDFVNTFGMFPGGIDFGNWVNQTERAAHLNAIYDAMYDLADVSGINPKMLGLGEKLKMAIGAQGRGGKTAAHYFPKLNEINLTKTKGDGSLGHEWQHGLDWNLQQTPNGKLLMQGTVSRLKNQIEIETVENYLKGVLRDTAGSTDNRNLPPKKAFFAAITNQGYWGTAPVIRDSDKQTQYFKDAQQLDKDEGREPRYWGTDVELLSRAFEAMLFDVSKGGSPYLVGPTVADGYITKKNGYSGTIYPLGKERPKLNEVYQQMLTQIDPETLEVKTYKMDTKIVEIEDLGYAVLDQYNLDSGTNGGLVWFKTEEEAKRMKAARDGQERVLTPTNMQMSKVNQHIIDMAKRIDGIMEEMGLFKWPEIKNGSMAESMFYHMRQGWWPKNNRELAEYGIKAYLQNPELLGFNPVKDQREIEKYKIADFEGDRVKLKQTQEDFEAAATRYISQVITDMRAQGSDTKAIYESIVNLYQNQPTLDVKSVLSQTNNAFSTPLPIAFLAGMLARVKSTTTVLDPTGGNGMLVVAANPQNVTTIELDPHRAENMRLMQIGTVIDGDVFDKIKDLRDQEVDVVLANPPFGALPTAVKIPSWTGEDYKITMRDQAIAAQSLRAMANNGRAVLILGAHPTTTLTTPDRVFLNWLYGNYNVADHYEIAGNLYRKQGANWPLRVLVIAGRNQTDNVYPIDSTVDRITTFDELWSRYVQTSDRSEQVVVGTGKRQPATGGADQPAGGVSTGDTAEDGGTGAGVGTGTGSGVGEQLPKTGRGAGTTAGGGRGVSGGAGTTEQQPDSGKGKRGGPSGVEAGGTQGGQDDGGGSGAELGGLSDLDLDNIFDDLGKPEKIKGGPRAPRGPAGPSAGGPRTPRGPAVAGPTVIPKDLEGLGLEDLFAELDAALNGKPPEENKPVKVSKPSKEKKAVKAEEKVTQLEPQIQEVNPFLGMDVYKNMMYEQYIQNKQLQEAMGRIAQDTKNTSDDPNSGMYSRKGDQDYANVQPIIQKVWNAVGEKISDVAQRIKQVYALLVGKFGEPIKAHLRTFVESLRTVIQKRPKNQTPVQSEPIDTESRVVYLGKSRFASDGIYLPRAQSQHAYSALENLEAQVGNIDEFVASELGYPSVEKMAKGLAGYQIDGLALAIQANKMGKGFIIGDDTGVGKGRAAAAMIVWAKKNGKIPIFVTVNDSMYTSMYEDLINIGHEEFKIGMTNNKAIIQRNIGGGKIKTVFENSGKDGPELMSYIKKNGALPKGMDVLFTAYSQLNGGAGSPQRQDAIASLVAQGKAVLIMDEAHNASGIPSDSDSRGQNAFFMSLLTGIDLLGKDVDPPEDWVPPPAVYLSATFAKRPDNMPLYIHTNLRYAANTPEELTNLFGKGVKTDVLQQVSSEMLVESGSMLRRERSYEGVKMDFVTDDANAPRDIREVDKVTTILRSLVNADRALKEWSKDPSNQALIINTLGPPGSMLGKEGPTAFAEAKGNPFTSVVHNYIGTLLLSAKTQTAVDMVIDKMNNGEKVVVGLQNTNGSALDDFVAKNGIKIGDEIPNFGWQTLLQRAIDSTRKITLKSATGNPKDNVKVEIPYSLMPPSIRAGYDNLADMVKDFQSDLPVAPIDYMRTQLEGKYVWTADGKTNVGDEPPAGVKARRLVVKEITGRNTAVDYSGDKPKYMALSNPERTEMISSFQNGEESENGPIDVLIINSAGATGISLHASTEAFDQRPRHMVVLQPHGDISVFIQLLGRIHRTGQVEWPSFTMLATGIPAERRILAMLRKKLSSLKSNTSGGSSSTKVNGVDFINRYGDVATAEYLNEHADIRAFLAQQSFADPDEAAGSDLAHKASGTAGLLSSSDQQEFFDSIEASYLANIELRNATGTNALERRVLPLNAEMIKENLIEEGLDSTNPFLSDVVMAQFNVDVIGSIPTQKNIEDDIAQALNGRTAQQIIEEIDTDLNTIFVEVRNQIILKQQALSAAIAAPGATEKDIAESTKLKEALDIQFATLGERREKTLSALRNQFAIGTGFDSFMINNVPAAAVVIGVKVDKSRIGKSKTGNPYSPSNFQVILKRNIPEGRVAPTLATLEGPSIERSIPMRRPPLDEWFALKSVTGGRTTRYIALGNILRAAQLFDKDGGEIAKFTLQNQTEEVSGVIMPVKYQPVAISDQPVRMRNANAAVQYTLAAWNEILRKKYDSTQMEDYKDIADSLGQYLLPNLPSFVPYAENSKNSYTSKVVRGANNIWTLTLDSYRPTGFRLSISGDAPKKFVTSIKGVSLAKKKGGPYEMSMRDVIADPVNLIALIKSLHRQYPATVEADAGPLAREVMKVEFDDAESKKGMFSRAIPEGGQSVEDVEAQIKAIKGINVKVVQSADNLPDAAAPADVEGAWFSGNTVYLVADNLPNAQRVQEVLAHEAIGHAALEGMLGKELMDVMVQNVQNLEKTSKVVQGIAAQIDRTQPGLSPERRAKEIVAMMAERGMQNSIIQRIIKAVRGWLRSSGFTLQFSDNDILALLQNAETFSGEMADATSEALYSRNFKGGPGALSTWEAADDLKLTDTLVYKFIDKHIDTKRVIEAIKNEAGRIEDAWNPYQKEELFHSRTAKQTKDFLIKDLRPLLEDMDKRGVTLQNLNDYLYNRHAKARNAFILKRDPTNPSGSGRTDAEVDTYMDALDKNQKLKKTYEEIAKNIDKIVKETQELLVSSGLETQGTIDTWRESLPFYVPLNREPDELDFVNASSGMGQGFGVRGSFTKAAVGSFKTVSDIVGSLALARERAIVRAEKVRVGRALYALAIQNPNPNFWKPINPDAIKNKTKLIEELVAMGMNPSDANNIFQEPKTGSIDSKTGLVKYAINPNMRNSPNVLALRINGQDRYVFFNPGNPSAKRMVETLKNVGINDLDEVLGSVAEITRFMAAVNTQYNPVFGAWNFTRDLQGAAINLSSTPLADKKGQVIADSMTAVRAIYRTLRGKPATNPEMQKWMDLFERFQQAGGQTGFREQFSRGQGKDTIVAREMARLSRGNVKKAAYAVFDWLSDYNDALENAVRLSAFKAALDINMSEDQAASLAKNLTVNFNRKGASTTTIAALYAFFNAAVQGTKRLAETLFTKDKTGKIKLSSLGKKIIAGGMFLGVMQAAILAMAGLGADEPPEWVKSKNLVIPVGDGKYLTIPMPLGFNVFPNVGRLIAEYMMVQAGAMNGRRDLQTTITNIFGAILGSVNPLGTSTFAQTLAPTIVDPFVAIAENRDAFGRPISREDKALAPSPGYTRSRETANFVSQGLAYGINFITGGGDKGIGLVSPTADQISYVAGQYAGGVGKLAIQTGEYVKSLITGEEVETYQIPVAGKLYGDINTPAAVAGVFYENIKVMSNHERIIKEMKGKGVEAYYKDTPEARLWRRANYVENEVARLKKEKKALKERDAPEAQIKRKDEAIKEKMDAFNKQVSKVQ
jgi:predicted methyltransferase